MVLWWKARAVKASQGTRDLPPFPTRQLFILCLCRICEPIALYSIFPYVYYMVQDFSITDDESKIAFYAGMVTTAFTLAEFSTGFLWGRLSDKIGRKPVLLCGMGGTGISVLIFGLAPSLPVALLARALGGFLNGNVGVLQTTVAELVTVKEHQYSAYRIMPMVSAIGSVIGPMVGGALAKPVATLPSVFLPGSIWDRFPYLLPNLVSAACVLFGLFIGIFFLEETHAEKRLQPDLGVELGRRLVARLCRQSSGGWMTWTKHVEEQPLLESDDPVPGSCTAEIAHPACPTTLAVTREGHGFATARPVVKRPTGKVFSPSIICIIITYGFIGFHTITFDSLLPVMLSVKAPEYAEVKLPLKFPGGFGFDTKTIGMIMSSQGLYTMACNWFVCPRITARLGLLQLFRLLSASYFLLYFTTPYIVLLPSSLQMVGVYGLIVWKCTFALLVYQSNAILLANSAPSTLSLGTINGVAASTVSLSRAIGPTFSGFLYKLGCDKGYSGLAWWVTGLISLVGALFCIGIREPGGRIDERDAKDEKDDLETAT